mmetsp:Transcript_32316/g.94527  ORF Transcript_32316/g.94527 Transcript_32316/m.94527 type:complete len:216 (-) Transcript_32316:1227-1874(-)
MSRLSLAEATTAATSPATLPSASMSSKPAGGDDQLPPIPPALDVQPTPGDGLEIARCRSERRRPSVGAPFGESCSAATVLPGTWAVSSKTPVAHGRSTSKEVRMPPTSPMKPRMSSGLTMPSPEAVSRTRNAISSDSSCASISGLAKSANATHSTHSMQALQSRSRSRLTADTSGLDARRPSPRSSLKPAVSSANVSRPSMSVSSAKNSVYQGSG